MQGIYGKQKLCTIISYAVFCSESQEKYTVGS